MTRYRLATFFILAFALSWYPWLIALIQHCWTLDVSDNERRSNFAERGTSITPREIKAWSIEVRCGSTASRPTIRSQLHHPAGATLNATACRLLLMKQIPVDAFR